MASSHRNLNGFQNSHKATQNNMNHKNNLSQPVTITKKSPNNHVRLSPRRPLTETLKVDVHLANEKFQQLSPGRRCLSDSKVVRSSKGSIPVSPSKKRKLEFQQKSVSLTPGKFYKLDDEVSLKVHNNMSITDINQNFSKEEICLKNDNKCNGSNSALTPSPITPNRSPSPSFYKAQHRIGSRRASNSYFSYSETTLSSPWKITKTRVKNKHSPVPPFDTRSSQVSDNVKQMSNSDINKSPKEDLLLEDEVFASDGSDNKKLAVVQKIQNGKVPNEKSDSDVTHNDETDKNSAKQKEVKSRKHKHSEKEPVLPRARKRRLASLDAETKVHILFEREESTKTYGSKVSERKKKKKTLIVPTAHDESKSDVPETTSSQFTKIIKKPQENIKQSSHPSQLTKICVPATSKITPSKVSCSARVHGPHPVCNKIPGKVTCLNCGSETPAIYVHPPSEINKRLPRSSLSPKGLQGKPPSMHLLSANRSKNSTSLPHAVLELLQNERAAVIHMLTLLAQWKQMCTDSAETADSALKRKLSRRLSKRSVGEDEACHFSNQFINYLLSLLKPKVPHSVPETFITYQPGRPRLIRKINKPPGLKPVSEKLGRKKSTNGWRGVGKPVPKPIVYFNEFERELRYCYDSIKRRDDVISVRDCVLLRAGPKKKDIPFVAKVSAIFEDPETGDIMFSLLWFYRPEHTETGRQPEHVEQELFACRHYDVNNVSCIEDKCYVLTVDEYCRFRADLRKEEERVCQGIRYVPCLPKGQPSQTNLPTMDTAPENVFVCRQVYDYKQRRLVKNPLCKLT